MKKQLLSFNLLTLLLTTIVLHSNAQPGSLDTTFGTGGIVTTSFPGTLGYYYGRSIAIQPDGKVLLAGYSVYNYNYKAALVRYNTNGSLDPSFSSDGIVNAPLNKTIHAITLQPDNKIVAVGWEAAPGGGDVWAGFVLMRFNTDGTLDPSFSSDGIANTLPVGGDNAGNAVAIQTDGKILVAGSAYIGYGNWTNDFALARYNTDGSIDSTFSSDGGVTTNFNRPNFTNPDDIARAVIIQTDNKIIIAGSSAGDFALARYNTDGSIDSTFDSDGKLYISLSSSDDLAYAAVLQTDGKIVVGGYSNSSFALLRYNTNGSLDSTFSSDGIIITPMNGGGKGYSLAMQTDGKIIVAGYSNDVNPYFSNFSLARYNTDGSLDSIFDSDGKVSTPISSSNNQAYSVAIQADGKIIAGGNDVGSCNCFALARYNVIAPELLLEGNNKEISNADISPSINDGTNYGTGCSSRITTYTIKNKGNADLAITLPISISGTNAADFTVLANPNTTITPGDSTMFAIQFSPGTSGVKTASISIGNSDPNENPYTYSIQGTGNIVNTSVTVTGNYSLEADADWAIYQWVDCNNGFAMFPSEIYQTLYLSNGNFAVIVTQNGCSDTSLCYNISTVGISQLVDHNQLAVYPNPSNGVFTIQSTSEGAYSIMNELGQVVQSVKLNNANKYTVNIENLNNGIYFIVGLNNNQITRQKIVVTK